MTIFYVYEIVKNPENSGKTIIVIGHSEGGSEAIYAGVYNDVQVVTFNAYGVSNRLLEGKSIDNIANYRTSNDIVSGTKMPQGEVYTVKSDQHPVLAKTPLGVKGGHQIQKMPDLENSVPHAQYRQENSPLRNINFGQNFGPVQNQNNHMALHQNMIMQQMVRDGVFLQDYSREQLEMIFYMHLLGRR